MSNYLDENPQEIKNAAYYRRQVKKLEQDNYELRMMLFMQHNHDGSSSCLYGDDGERQCNHINCGIDFVRDSVQIIKDKNYYSKMQDLIRLGFVKTVDNSQQSKV